MTLPRRASDDPPIAPGTRPSLHKALWRTSVTVASLLVFGLGLLGAVLVERTPWPIAFAPLAAAIGAIALHGLAVARTLIPASTARERAHRDAAAAERDDALTEARATQRDASREVHHRIKNNIQVIASVISLHARSAASPEAAAAYAAIQRRVEAMAVVQRNHLAELGAPAAIALRSLLGEVGTNLCASYAGTPPALALHCEPLNVTPEAAIAIAFLMVELVELAALIEPGTSVTIDARRDGAVGRLEVTTPAFADHAAVDRALASRYGRVIDGLVRQLRGQLGRDDQGFSSSFPLLAPAE